VPENWVWLARIRRPQGRKGEVLAELLTDFPEKFAERKRLWVLKPDGAGAPSSASVSVSASVGATGPSHLGTRETMPVPPQARPVELANHWLHKGGVVLHFSGVDSISAAEALTGLYVAIPRAERAPLAADETYIGDLIGCVLVDVAGAATVNVGEIEDVDRSAGPVPLLVVRGASGEVLIPFAKSYLRKLDLEGRRVEMALPEGLVDLNAPGA
jgi:16S rRNA processing protein RimM